MTTIMNYDGNTYVSRNNSTKFTGYVLATAVSSAILSPLVLLGKPFSKQLTKSYINNSIYKTKLEEAVKLPIFRNNNVKIKEAQKINSKYFQDEAKGLNACYVNDFREVWLNTDKISIAGFHELGHAESHLSKNILIKALVNYRYFGYLTAGLMEYFAVFSRNKPKEAKKNTTDIIEDNCGKIAFLAMTPIVAEEALASYKGIKIAKKVNLPKPLVNEVKNCYKKALHTYVGRAILGGLAVGASRMIMDYYTRPKQISYSIYDKWG